MFTFGEIGNNVRVIDKNGVNMVRNVSVQTGYFRKQELYFKNNRQKQSQHFQMTEPPPYNSALIVFLR